MEHCPNHDSRGLEIGELKTTTEGIRTERKTERYMTRGFLVLAAIISSICVWLFNDNLNILRTDIKEIKAYMAVGNVVDASTRIELENIKWRLQQLEATRGNK